ncbi:sulfotransferase [Rhodanobacter sp. C03]|uniref:tetratricopeptide repeat-containing sulfotransferase family protein n=1 Tax=Rhodanobacter sp. C03 TaxID=1945858 RepID=UPI0009857203|nr:sulfotransferase [Rhodanobacter sp. C03]OOG59448.1 sulfotransferase [Rhodanobacter sp. C03]
MTDPAELFAQLTAAFNRRAWTQALQLAEQLLPLAPHHPGVNYIAGIAHLELQQMPKALDCLHQAMQLEPRRADYATQYAKALALVRLMRDARLTADRAMALSPDDPITLDTLGVIYTQANAHEQAAMAFRGAVALMPSHPPYRFNLATALVAAGDIDAAEHELEACIGLAPGYWKAHLTLAQLRRQTPTSNHIERLQSVLSQLADNSDAQTYLNMALAKEYEDIADYPAAFGHYVRGKSAGRHTRGYSIQSDEVLFDALTAAFPDPEVTTSGCPTEEPIFVIGMPRTGTTLLERIITSHPDVYSAGELQNFGMALKYATRSPSALLLDPETIARASHVDWKEVGETYLSSTRPATGNKPHFIDKLPHNFLYAGFIAHALPNAKIICLRRDPMDTCLSNFRQLFGALSPYYGYSFDLLDTGRYYVLFDRLMAHWQCVFPGRILEMDYETLVESQEASSRRLLEFCGLSWNDACLSFENNPAPVNTASAVQVRAPVYRSALKRWKKYEPQLRALQALLDEAGIKLAQ